MRAVSTLHRCFLTYNWLMFLINLSDIENTRSEEKNALNTHTLLNNIKKKKIKGFPLTGVGLAEILQGDKALSS